MKTVDEKAVEARLNELRQAAKILEQFAQPIYSTAGADPSLDQVWEIYSRLAHNDHFGAVQAAKSVLYESADKGNERINDDQRRDFLRKITSVRGKLYRKRTPPEYFVVSRGTVRVDEKRVRKLLEQKHTISVSDEYATMNIWAQSFINVINSCPDPGVKRRLGKFALQMGHELKGQKVEARGEDLVVIEG